MANVTKQTDILTLLAEIDSVLKPTPIELGKLRLLLFELREELKIIRLEIEHDNKARALLFVQSAMDLIQGGKGE